MLANSASKLNHMKIRIRGNSLRYRLTRSEVEQFLRTGHVEEKINFGNADLTYVIQRSEQDQLSASFENNQIIFYLPASMAEQWKNDDIVGFDYEMPLNNSEEKLSLLIEKDFTCLDKIDEDQTDNYPNPLLKQL